MTGNILGNMIRTFSLFLLGVVCLAAIPACTQGENEKPNVVIIFADDLGYGDLSCFGAHDVNTFHIDGLILIRCKK